MKRLGLALSLLLGSCTSTTPTQQNTTSFTVYYNNDNVGYLSTCGCRITPIGGMYRRWNALQNTPSENRIFVDAGNLFFKSKEAPDYLVSQWFQQALGVVEAYNLLEASAYTPGENDFALGLTRLEALRTKAKFAFLSSNIYEKQTNKLWLAPSLVLQKNGVKIGLFALYNPAFTLPPSLEARDPIASALQQVESLKKDGAEFIILLSHQGLDADKDLAKKVKGIDLIVGAHSQSLLQSPEPVRLTQIVQLSNQGQMLGAMEYERNSSGAIQLKHSIVAELNSSFDQAKDKSKPNPMHSLVEVTNIKIEAAGKQQEQLLWDSHSAMDGSGYQTFLNCRGCHAKQAEFQEGQLHAAAMLTLVARKQSRNLDCVKCHSVGLGDAGGFRQISSAILDKNKQAIALESVVQKANLTDAHYREEPTKIRPDVARWIDALKQVGADKAFVGVQCENCHGPRPDHPFSKDANSAKVLSTRCLQCHTKEQMPAWYNSKGQVHEAKLKEALAAVTCPR